MPEASHATTVEFGPVSTALLNQILALGEKLVTALTDLQAAQTALDTEVQTALADLVTLGNAITALVAQLAAGISSGDQAAIESTVTDLQTQTANLQGALTTALATIPASTTTAPASQTVPAPAAAPAA
jgi:hypothetical protein